MKQSISHLLAALVLLLWTTSAGAESYTGTLERHGAKIEYSFSGECKVTDKTKAEYGGLYPTTVGTSIDGEVKVGSTLNLSCKKLKGSEKWKTLKIAITVGTINNNFINYDKIESDNGVASKSITVPDEVVTDDGEKVKVKSIHISYFKPHKKYFGLIFIYKKYIFLLKLLYFIVNSIIL